MTQKIHFTKMHGAGNDYIYVDTLLYTIEDPAELARTWSDRHKGIGSDGLVLIGRSPIPEADFTMNIFNADGSEAMMCGNASRCIGKYLFEKGLTDSTHIRLLTLSGIKVLNLHLAPTLPDSTISTEGQSNVALSIVESVTVDMGVPVFEDTKLYISQLQSLPTGYFVSMGNPHYVIFVNDIDSVDIATEGSALENHAAFPQRANIEFAEMRPDGIRVRVWERGSGITMACGTGACATAVAAAVSKRSGRSSHIIMDGGSLDIEWKEDDNHVYMTGGATLVYEGDIPIEQL